MKAKRILCWSSVLWLSAGLTHAQDTNDPARFEKLFKQMQEKQEMLERMVREQKQEIESLKRQIETSRTNALPALAPTPPTVETSTTPPATESTTVETGKPWTPTSPIGFGNARNYLNISFDALVAAGTSTANDIEQLQLGGHDPKQRGFTVQNLESVFEGKVDPYFRGQANVIMQIDPHGETTIEAEEAYLETLSLPLNLQVKAGQFFSEFGRLNSTHPHAWDFVDQPLVNGRFLGGDGLRNPGARLSWLAPTPFYSELFLGMANSQGETVFSFRNEHEGETFMGRPATEGNVNNLGDMLFVPRYAASFNLSDSQTIVAGTSAAFGPNSSGGGADTQIYGVDLFYKWKSPLQHGGFPYVSWQTEAMMRRFHAASFAGDSDIPPLPAETIVDFGVYSQVAWGFRKGWVAALRGDYVFPETRARYEELTETDPNRASRWRISPNVTFYPSEFSKIRLQYNYDNRHGIGEDHSVWVQFEILLGTHAAHKF